jgi:hypothetical protein
MGEDVHRLVLDGEAIDVWPAAVDENDRPVGAM